MTSQSACGLLSLIGLVTLTACGGGGGGGGGGGSATVKLTPANSRQAATTAFNGASGANSVAGVSSAAYRSVEAGTRPSRFDIPDFLVRQINGLTARRTLAVVNAPETIPCGSGTITSVFDDRDNNGEVSTGDSFSLTFNQCDDEGFIINGSIVLDQLVVTGDTEGNSFTFQARIAFSNLSTTEDGVTETVNGTIRTSLSATISQLTVGLDILADLTDGETTLGTGTSLQEVETETSSTETLQGNVSDVDFGGRVTYSTTVPFVTEDVDDYPSTGILVITGTSGSTLRLIALNNVDARIELDENGDGTFESVEELPWTVLDSLFDG